MAPPWHCTKPVHRGLRRLPANQRRRDPKASNTTDHAVTRSAARTPKPAPASDAAHEMLHQVDRLLFSGGRLLLTGDLEPFREPLGERTELLAAFRRRSWAGVGGSAASGKGSREPVRRAAASRWAQIADPCGAALRSRATDLASRSVQCDMKTLTRRRVSGTG